MIINILGINMLVDNLGHLVIALSLSISSWINALILYVFIHIRGYWKIDLFF